MAAPTAAVLAYPGYVDMSTVGYRSPKLHNTLQLSLLSLVLTNKRPEVQNSLEWNTFLLAYMYTCVM